MSTTSTTFTVRGASSGWVFDLGHVISMETVLCARCGLLYALPEALIKAARAKGHGEITWRCPNNSCSAMNWGYHGKSEADKERERRESAEAAAKWERDRAARLSATLDQTKASLRSQKGATTKAKRRHAAGLCPCCNRTFQQLTRHMATKHPDYKL